MTCRYYDKELGGCPIFYSYINPDCDELCLIGMGKVKITVNGKTPTLDDLKRLMEIK